MVSAYRKAIGRTQAALALAHLANYPERLAIAAVRPPESKFAISVVVAVILPSAAAAGDLVLAAGAAAGLDPTRRPVVRAAEGRCPSVAIEELALVAAGRCKIVAAALQQCSSAVAAFLEALGRRGAHAPHELLLVIRLPAGAGKPALALLTLDGMLDRGLRIAGAGPDFSRSARAGGQCPMARRLFALALGQVGAQAPVLVGINVANPARTDKAAAAFLVLTGKAECAAGILFAAFIEGLLRAAVLQGGSALADFLGRIRIGDAHAPGKMPLETGLPTWTGQAAVLFTGLFGLFYGAVCIFAASFLAHDIFRLSRFGVRGGYESTAFQKFPVACLGVGKPGFCGGFVHAPVEIDIKAETPAAATQIALQFIVLTVLLNGSAGVLPAGLGEAGFRCWCRFSGWLRRRLRLFWGYSDGLLGLDTGYAAVVGLFGRQPGFQETVRARAFLAWPGKSPCPAFGFFVTGFLALIGQRCGQREIAIVEPWPVGAGLAFTGRGCSCRKNESNNRHYEFVRPVVQSHRRSHREFVS